MATVLPREGAFAPRTGTRDRLRASLATLGSIDTCFRRMAKSPQLSHCSFFPLVTTHIIILPLVRGRHDIFISPSPTPSLAGYTCWRRLYEGQHLESGLLGSARPQLGTSKYQAIRTLGQSSHDRKEPRRCRSAHIVDLTDMSFAECLVTLVIGYQITSSHFPSATCPPPSRAPLPPRLPPSRGPRSSAPHPSC